MKNGFLLFIMMLSLMACKSNKQAATQQEGLESKISSLIGPTYQKDERTDWVLCIASDPDTNGTWNTVLVIDQLTGEVIYGPVKLNAQVKWYADKQLFITDFSEVIRDKQGASSTSYIYDLTTKQRVDNSL